jgi:hypothetical protein
MESWPRGLKHGIILEGIIYQQTSGNSKLEYRNPKQILISNVPITKTDVTQIAGVSLFLIIHSAFNFEP